MAKRTFDLLAGALLGVVALPFVAGGALVSAVCLRAWPFFVQARVGLGGRSFRIVKIRTLPVATPRYIDKHGLAEVSIPAPMRAMRRVHLDELPQIYLAVLGTMSLVGPRPEMRHLHESMQPGVAEARVSVRPGCTGLWQVSDLASELISQGTKLDLLYIEHRSMRFDLWILFRTVFIALGLAKPVSVDRLPVWIDHVEQRAERRVAPVVSVASAGPGEVTGVDSGRR